MARTEFSCRHLALLQKSPTSVPEKKFSSEDTRSVLGVCKVHSTQCTFKNKTKKIQVFYNIFLLRSKIEGAILEETMKSQLREIIDSTDADETIAFQLSNKVMVVKTPVSALSPLGFVHVYKTDLGKIDCGFRYNKPKL